MGKDALIRSPEFTKLCASLKRQTIGLELNDAIDTFKVMIYIGVPSSTDIVECLLNVIQCRANDLNLSQIIFLDFLLEKCYSTPLCRALKMALPIVFSANLSTKFDPTCNSSNLARMLQYVVKCNLPFSSVQFLLTHIQKRIDTIDATSASIIVHSLIMLPSLTNLGQEILHQTLETVASSISEIPIRECENILSLLVGKYSQSCTYYYHSMFFSACAKYIVQRECGLDLASKYIRKLSQIGHVDTDLLDYIGEKIMQNPEAFINSRPSVLFSVVTGYSKANYEPVDWTSIKYIILKHKLLIQQDNVALPWIKLAVELASLNCFPSHLIEYIFGESFLKKFLARENNFLDLMQLLLLHQAVVTLMPSYAGPWPPDDIIQKASALNGSNITDFPLRGALEHGLGGNAYVCTRVFTKLGHFIDHAVAIRTGGFPVAINQNRTTTSRLLVEDFNVPSDCKVILILCMHENCYAVNCNRLKGLHCLLERSLQAMGYSVALISLEAWNQLPSHEKIPYIMRVINSTYDAE
ncbi:FAST kinase domain-containing protein 2, mitochondrial isoform X2 [Anabrus simplex]